MQRHAPLDRRPLDPTRLRRIRDGFSWIDRRFLRDEWIDRLARDEILLYLFLATVADRFGTSWYSDRRTSRLLKVPPEDLDRARSALVERGLLLYRAPVYQVLDLAPPEDPPREGRTASLAEILQGMAAGTAAAGRGRKEAG